MPWMCTYPEIIVNAIESGGIFWKLIPDVFAADKYGLEMAPSPLYLKPDGDDLHNRLFF